MKNKKQARNVLLAKPWKSSQIKAHINVDITLDLITETMLVRRQQQFWTILNSKDSQDFIKKFLS